MAYERNQMTPRRALALAVMACQFVADTEGKDIPDWQQAVMVLRDLLHETRPDPVGRWVWYTGDGKNRGRYETGTDL